MKIIIRPILSAVAVAFCSYASYGASVSLDVTSATDKDNPLAFGGANGDAYVLTTSRSDMVPWVDYYLYMDRASIDNVVYSTGGKGYHANYHIMLDASNSVFESSSSTPISFNTNSNNIGESSAGYYLESKDGTAVTFNATNAGGIRVSLTSADTNGIPGSDVVYGTHGNTFYIGQNFTFNAQSLVVKGRLTTDQTDYVDSIFTVAGNLNLLNADADPALSFNGTNALIDTTGVVTSNGKIQVSSNSDLEVKGTLATYKPLTISSSNVTIAEGGTIDLIVDSATTPGNLNVNSSNLSVAGVLKSSVGGYINSGSTVTVESTGAIGGMMVLQGGTLIVNGKLIAHRGTGTVNLGATNGTLIVGDTADLSSVYALELRGGTLNVESDVSIGVLRTNEGKEAVLNIAEGKTYTTESANFNTGSNTTVNGDLNITKTFYFVGDTFTVKSGTMTVGPLTSTSFTNRGTLTVSKGAQLNISTSDGGSWGIIYAPKLGNQLVVDGGTLSLSSKIDTSYSANVNGTLSLLNGGVVASNSSAYIGITAGGTLMADSTSKIDATKIVFATSIDATDYNEQKKLVLGAGSVYNAEIVAVRTQNNIVELSSGESYMFSSVKFHDVSGYVEGQYNDITFDLNGAKEVVIGSVKELGGAALGTLIFNDFAAGVVKVENFTTDMISTGTCTIGGLTLNLVAYDYMGNKLNGTWSVDQNGYLFNSAIPEPAEWAAIFAGLSLLAAVLRRRSK